VPTTPAVSGYGFGSCSQDAQSYLISEYEKNQEAQMFLFLLEVIGVSILVSLFANWIKLVPRYPKRKYALIQQLTNTGFLTILLTLLFSFGVYPSWLILFAIILLILWLSVLITGAIVRRGGESTVETPNREHE